MIIKELTPIEFLENIKEITELFKISYETSFQDILLSNEFFEKKVQQAYSFLGANEATILGYFNKNNKLCAFAYIYSTFVFDKKYIHLNHISVLPNYQHTGIGRTLLNYIFDKAMTDNVYAIKLDVSVCNNIATDFYYKLGFKPTRYQMEKIL